MEMGKIGAVGDRVSIDLGKSEKHEFFKARLLYSFFGFFLFVTLSILFDLFLEK